MQLSPNDLEPWQEHILGELVGKQVELHGARGRARVSRRFSSRWSRVAVVCASGFVAMAAVLGGLTLSHGTSTLGAPRSPGPLRSGKASATGLISHTAAVVAAAYSSDIIESTAPVGSGTIQNWEDPVSGTWRTVGFDSTGQMIGESAFRVNSSTMSHIVINFQQRIFFSTTVTLQPGIPTPQLPDSASALSTELRDNLSSGRWVIQGTAVVDGHTTEVVHIQPGVGNAAGATLWIDQATGLPVQQVTPRGTITYRWLPRTEQNIAAMWPTPPAGFTQIAPPTLPTAWTTP